MANFNYKDLYTKYNGHLYVDFLNMLAERMVSSLSLEEREQLMWCGIQGYLHEELVNCVDYAQSRMDSLDDKED